MKLLSDIKISETILIALTPFLGYIAAFFYKMGQFSVLKVPVEYIQINTELVILSSSLTFSISLIVIIAILLLSKIFMTSGDELKYTQKGSKITRFIGAILITLLIPILSTLFLVQTEIFSTWHVITISLGLFILFSGLIFLPPLTRYRNEKNYLTKFENYQREIHERNIKLAKMKNGGTKQHDIFYELISFFGAQEGDAIYSYIKVTICSIIWAVLALLLGASSVYNTDSYWISKIDNRNYVVLGVYSKNFILVGIDRERKITTNEVLLINRDNELQLSQENIGALNQNDSRP